MYNKKDTYVSYSHRVKFGLYFNEIWVTYMYNNSKLIIYIKDLNLQYNIY